MNGDDIPRMLQEAPLPELIRQLGVAIAEAQRALDENSICMAHAMATQTYTIGSSELSLLELGFTPAFYAFTEATVEAKLTFSMQESKETSVGGSFGVSYFQLIAASVNASYTRKFSFQAEGASSIAARLVSLPPPARFMEKLHAQSKT
jgi:hypothetical protein